MWLWGMYIAGFLTLLVSAGVMAVDVIMWNRLLFVLFHVVAFNDGMEYEVYILNFLIY